MTPELTAPKDITLDLLKVRVLNRLARRRKLIKHVKLPTRYGRVHVTVNRPKGDGYTNNQRYLLNKARNQPR